MSGSLRLARAPLAKELAGEITGGVGFHFPSNAQLETKDLKKLMLLSLGPEKSIHVQI